MKLCLLLAFVLLPLLVGCNIFGGPPPTPVPPTPTVEPTRTVAPTATLNPTPTLVLMPTVPIATAPPSKQPVEVTPSLNPNARRIQFGTGAVSSKTEGSLAANKVDTYVLRALAGQRMTIVASSPGANLLLQISGADGTPLKSMSVGGPSWSGVLPTTQDYVIAVSTENGAPATYSLEVTIPPLAK